MLPRSSVVSLGTLGMLALAACTASPPSAAPFPWPSPTPEVVSQVDPRRARTSLATAQFHFSQVLTAEEVPQSTVEAVFQDRRGYVWLATHNGAYRFDGYESTDFHHEPQNPDSLRSDVVYALAEDRFGSLWFGTQSGLDRLDPASDRFFHFDLGGKAEGIGRSEVITTLMLDATGNLWAGTHAGIFRLTIEEDKVTAIAQYDSLHVGTGREQGLLAASLFQDSAGTIWAGTQHGLARFDPETDAFTRVPSSTFTAPSPITQPARQAEYAAAGLYAPFVDTPVIIQAMTEVKPGLLLLSGENLTLYNTRANVAYPLDAQEFMNAPDHLQSSRAWSMLRDSAGMIWIGLDAGLARFDPSTYHGQFIAFAAEEAADSRIVLSMLQDAEGNIWLGTAGGNVFLYAPARLKFAPVGAELAQALAAANVWAITEDHRGALWIGTDTGVLRSDRMGGEVADLPLVTTSDGDQDPQSVRALAEDLGGDIWAGTANGKLFMHEPGSADFVQQLSSQIGSGYPINDLLVDRDGDLWIATNNGVYRHSFANGTTQYFLNDPARSDSLCHNRVLAIQEGAQGSLSMGTWAGLCTFDKTTQAFSRPSLPEDVVSSPNPPIFAVAPGQSNGLWIAGQVGAIQHLDLATGEISSYSDPDGSTVGLIYCMLEDEDGHLWFTSSRGLASFDPQTAAFASYSREDGLPVGVFNMGAHARASDGTLFFGGQGGLVTFAPRDVPHNPYVPPVLITELTQGGAPIALDGGAAHPEHVTITWPNNYFEFEFVGLSFAKPEDNQYAYYLQGVDRDWVYAGKNRRGRYVNLAGGDYVLHLSASNNDGLWDSDSTQLRITVVPPLWQRSWVRLLGVLVLLGIVLAGYRYRVRRIVGRSRELESLVQERTSQLTGINTELRQVVAQRKEAEQKLAQRMAAEAVTIERNRLARDLHDAVTQTIFSASILSETLPHSLDANPTKAREQIQELHRLTQGALAELRSLLVELRPEGLVRTDLADLLGQLCRGTGGRTGIPVELSCDLREEVPSEVKVTLYRIAQEALSNASRHAGPSCIRVECTSDRTRITLRVHDDGRGFDRAQAAGGHLGLGIMAERAADIGANFTIVSEPGRGTDIQLEWLFPREAESDERH